MSAPAVTPDPLQLVVGDEELLVERAVRAALDAARKIDAQADLTRIRVTDLTPPELAELVSPSLFAEGRVIALEAAQEAGKEIADTVIAYAKAPADGITLVVIHSGGGRSKAAKELPAALRKAGAVVIDCPKITKANEREAFVRNEVRSAGGKIDPEGIAVLIDSVGTDLRELAAAASQLVADSGGNVNADEVRRYHRGRAEVTGFAVAEKAVIGDRAGALEALRWAMQTGVPHVLVADALADSVRTIARVSAAGRADPFQLAGKLGMPPWKVKKAQGQSRGWDSSGLAEAMSVVALLNADVKGVAADADYALERAVLRIVAVHGGR
ncbi:DNA polymerase III subunit delta [Umezawaea sp. Da 62-37]|uniref:DNA polymerase III subunit delta n=1 Tax=Umezawaea sp. Da 62-37 TaxID=3075927 RepID=UPI0028F6E3E9|nr:DNA polymerase III subunit delta [Umezawaea sp. Da 62-37]WNV83321.1 DNA polymerase III subunit delta [Umezawaea sp. Da 62-37]